MQWSKWPIPGKVQLERAYDDFMTFFEKQVFSCLIFSNRKDIKAKSICKFQNEKKKSCLSKGGLISEGKKTEKKSCMRTGW